MTKSFADYRGSRLHVLNWVESPDFLSEINAILKPTGAAIEPNADWMPRGRQNPKEARLEIVDTKYLPAQKRDQLRNWWLKHQAGANTPNWDFLSPSQIEGKPGFVLLEAKANKKELSEAGKKLIPNARTKTVSARSRENHDYICAAISAASSELCKVVPGIAISAANHYQFANRIAFAWKLAQLDVPVILIYLAFTKDEGIRDAGEPFEDADDWKNFFTGATRGIFPGEAVGRRIECGPAPFWLLLASRPAPSQSPPKTARRKHKHTTADRLTG
jgi:hypothetical protein